MLPPKLCLPAHPQQQVSPYRKSCIPLLDRWMSCQISCRFMTLRLVAE